MQWQPDPTLLTLQRAAADGKIQWDGVGHGRINGLVLKLVHQPMVFGGRYIFASLRSGNEVVWQIDQPSRFSPSAKIIREIVNQSQIATAQRHRGIVDRALEG